MLRILGSLKFVVVVTLSISEHCLGFLNFRLQVWLSLVPIKSRFGHWRKMAHMQSTLAKWILEVRWRWRLFESSWKLMTSWIGHSISRILKTSAALEKSWSGWTIFLQRFMSFGSWKGRRIHRSDIDLKMDLLLQPMWSSCLLWKTWSATLDPEVPLVGSSRVSGNGDSNKVQDIPLKSILLPNEVMDWYLDCAKKLWAEHFRV